MLEVICGINGVPRCSCLMIAYINCKNMYDMNNVTTHSRTFTLQINLYRQHATRIRERLDRGSYRENLYLYQPIRLLCPWFFLNLCPLSLLVTYPFLCGIVTTAFLMLSFVFGPWRDKYAHIVCIGPRGGAVGWGTALKAGRSRVRFPMVSLEFFFDIILLAALWPWGRLSLKQKWVPGILPGG